MNKIAFLISFASVLSPAYAAESTACYKVEGMTCAACSVTIKVAVKKLDGIGSVVVDTKDGSAKVRFDDKKTSSERIAKAIGGAGYNASEKACHN